MRRVIAIGAVVAAILIVLVIATASGSGDEKYEVRAIFDNAGFLVTGEDVKSSGVVIGRISALDVTPDNKAVVVLEITDPAFRDFKQDARCQVRLQSLLGEKYVACQPTQPRNDGEQPAPALRPIEAGPNKGQYLLPISQTSSPVDLDLLNNVMQLPERQRLALIINEFGTGLAGNGDELRAAIRRAYPALDEFDRFLRVLADQNKVTAKLAEDSDVALAVLARESGSISNFIDKAGKTATATAERGDALERNFELLAPFLRELTPMMARLEDFSTAATPVFADLRTAAPSVNQIFEQLGPFSTAALPAFRTLGDAAEVTRRALVSARPVIQDLGQFAKASKPLARDLAVGLKDLKDQRGIERFMQTVLGFAGAMNGFDAVGHYLRTSVVLEATCLRYLVVGTDCSANFSQRQLLESFANGTASAAAAPEDAAPESDDASSSSPPLALPDVTLPSAQPQDASADAAPTTATSGEPGDATADEDPRAGVLGYLLGSEAVR